jgi:hypothetical protein
MLGRETVRPRHGMGPFDEQAGERAQRAMPQGDYGQKPRNALNADVKPPQRQVLGSALQGQRYERDVATGRQKRTMHRFS